MKDRETILLLVVSSASPTIAIQPWIHTDLLFAQSSTYCPKSSASLTLKPTLEAFLYVTLDIYLLKHFLHANHVATNLYLKAGEETELGQQSKFRGFIKQEQ